MKRRTLLTAGVGLLAGGLALAQGLRLRQIKDQVIATAMADLTALQGRSLRATGAWPAGKVFAHLEQSIRCSMQGYPDMKPGWFRHTLGPAALFVFEARGAMSHRLDEPIPGTPILAEDLDVQSTLESLIDSLAAFATFDGPLQPHFAYGELDHGRYVRAHVLHIRQHLTEIVPD